MGLTTNPLQTSNQGFRTKIPGRGLVQYFDSIAVVLIIRLGVSFLRFAKLARLFYLLD